MSYDGRALVVMPTYNEADNIVPITQAILAQKLGLHILIVDDNSPDGTGKLADELAAQHAEIHVMHRAGKLGLGTAYVQGFRWALEHGYEFVLEMDSDFSHNPDYLPQMMRLAETHAVVIGSRYVRGGGTLNWGASRKLISWGGNLFARTLLRLRPFDCTAGYKCYHRAVIEAIPWDNLNLQGYGFQVATIYHAQRRGFSIAEQPIIFEDRRVGHSKMSRAIVIEAFRYVLRQAWEDLRGGAPVAASNTPAASMPYVTSDK